MRRFFVEDGYNFVAFVDDNNKAFIIDDTILIDEVPNPEEYITLEGVKQVDYSNLDNCETAEECAACIGTARAYNSIIDWDEDKYVEVTEF